MAEIIKIQKQQQLLKRVNIFLIDYFKLMVFMVFLLILLLGYFLILLPKYRQIVNELTETQKTQADKQAYYRQYFDKLDLLNQSYDRLDPVQLQKINSLLPDSPGVEQIMVDLQEITDENGAILSSLTVVPDETSAGLLSAEPPANQINAMAGLGRVNVSADLSGLDYQGLKKLLGVLEHNLRLLDVNSVSWSPFSHAVKLDLTAYYLKK